MLPSTSNACGYSLIISTFAKSSCAFPLFNLFINKLLQEQYRSLITSFSCRFNKPFVPRCSLSLIYVYLLHLGTSTLSTPHVLLVWGHGWLSSLTAQSSHLHLAHPGLKHSSHRLSRLKINEQNQSL